MKKTIYVLLLVLVAVGLRLYPTLISGVPFSTDAWSPIRNTELMIQNTPVPLNSKIFDGYNNFWPADSLFGAVISEVTGLRPVEAMPLFFPLVGAAAIFVLFALVRRLFDFKIALVASVVFATTFAHAFFTAAVTKETYASPLYLTLILIFLHPTIGRNRQVALFTLASVTLAFTHHLTSLIAALILTSLAVGNFVRNMRDGVSPKKPDFLLVAIPITVTSLYYGLFAQAGMSMPLTWPEWLSLGSFQLLAFAAVVYAMYKPSVNARTVFIVLAAVVSVSFFIALNLTTAIVPGFTLTAQESVLLYLAPNFIAVPFIVVGFEKERKSNGTIAPLFWIAPLIALEVFALLGNSAQSLALWIRTPNFICVPAAILTAVGLHWVIDKARGIRLQRLVKVFAATIIIVIAAIGVYSMYASVSLQDPNLGYQWLYSKQELTAGTWIKGAYNNQTITGDIKSSLLLRDFFGVKTDELQGFEYLNGETTTQPAILFTYEEMMKNGYALAVHGANLPENWTQETLQMNIVYSNNLVILYAGANSS